MSLTGEKMHNSGYVFDLLSFRNQPRFQMNIIVHAAIPEAQ